METDANNVPLVPNAKRCICCFGWEPQVEFGPKTGHLCTACYARAELDRKKEKRAEKAQANLRRLVASALSNKKLPTFVEISYELMGRYGGPAGLVKRFMASHEAAMDNKPGSQVCLNHFRTALEWLKLGMLEQQGTMELDQLSDEDLERALEDYAESKLGIRLLEQEPIDVDCA